MGKSAGKWIKNVLFGKKYSKSNLSKNIAAGEKASVKTPDEISYPRQLTEGGVENMELEKGTSGSSCDAIALSPSNHGITSQSGNASLLVGDTEKSRQEHAATIAQAAFRGYLARRAFRTLKGIVRLQALIRGHLVRRQAVATFRCMWAIVKLQALARKVRHADARTDVPKKLGTNTFVHKLPLKLPNAMPLSLQYDLSEPNSAWNWLERWSIARFWETPAGTKRTTKTKPQKNHAGAQVFESEVGKSRRMTRKILSVANGANGTLASSEVDKPKHKPRRATSYETELEEQPQNELERVKHNLRKISASAAAAFQKSETETEKKASNSAHPDVSEQEKFSSEKLISPDVVVGKLDLLEGPLNPKMDEPVDMTRDNLKIVESHSVENGSKMESLPTQDNELSCKEEQKGKDNQKIRKRRSLPAKHEFNENISQNSQSLPSYMLATESAKAKLRVQGSSKSGEDEVEYGIGRRHSLPASTSGKWSSLSPRMQKHVQANGKGGSKINKSVMTFRDDRVVQPGWRR